MALMCASTLLELEVLLRACALCKQQLDPPLEDTVAREKNNGLMLQSRPSSAVKQPQPVAFQQRWQMHGDERIDFQPGFLRIHVEDGTSGYAIVGRTNSTYHLVGQRGQLDVDVEDITDYVSALQLEIYENDTFHQEHERERLRKELKLRRQRNAELKRENDTETETEDSSSASDPAVVVVGKHGRPRPSYARQLVSLSELERLEKKARRIPKASSTPIDVEPSALPPEHVLSEGDHETTLSFATQLPRSETADAPTVLAACQAYQLGGSKAVLEAQSPLRSAEDGLTAASLSKEFPQQKIGPPADEGEEIIVRRPRAVSSHPTPQETTLDTERSSADLLLVDHILDHRLSDPSMHPPGFSTEAIMLYLVQWHDQSQSWEPRDSFDNQVLIDEYDNSVGIRDGRAG